MISHALILGLIMVESSNRDWVVNGDAAGCLQIRPGVIIDVNLYSHRHYRLDDRLDRRKSIEMLRIYLHHYCGDYADDHTLAMTWRFGPAGRIIADPIFSLRYWRTVKLYRDRPDLISPHEKQKPNTRGALRRFLTRVADLFCPSGYLPAQGALADAERYTEPHTYD